MSFSKGRVLIAFHKNENITAKKQIASRCLLGISCVFDLTLHPVTFVELPVEESVMGTSDYKYLLFEFEGNCHKSILRGLLASAVKYLQSLGLFFDIQLEMFPY